MKHTKAYISTVLLLSLVICSCGKKENTFQKPQLEEIRTICQLATMECYYNNVAKSVKTSGNGILHWGEKDRTFWIEYSGRAVLGVDMTKVEMKIRGKKVTITMPKAELLRISAEEKTFNEDSFVSSEDSFFNKNKITAMDQQKALADAQATMKEKVEADSTLFLRAQEKAKKLIQNYVNKIGELEGVEYQIIWKEQKK